MRGLTIRQAEPLPMPVDIAALTHFLLSAEAGLITGQNFVVDGGMTRQMIYRED